MTERLEPVFDKPYGPSQMRDISWGNNKSYHGLDCQMCGTTNNGTEDVPLTWSFIGDRQLVDSCCGKLLDDIYVTLGERFMEAYLGAFSRNPTNPRFSFFRGYQLPAALEVATQTISETTTAIGRLDRLTKEVSQRVEDKPTFA